MYKEQILRSVETDLREKYGREVSADEVLSNALFQYCLQQAQVFIAEAKVVKSTLTDDDATQFVQVVFLYALALLCNELDAKNMLPSSDEILDEYSIFLAANAGMEDEQEISLQLAAIMEIASKLENKHIGKEGFVNTLSQYTDESFSELAGELYEKVLASPDLFELKSDT